MTSLPALREAVAKEDQQMPSEIAIATAAQCWCDPRTETREMDVELATVFAERVDAWIETARQHAHNEEYYRGLLDRIGERVGPSAYVSDDGSVQDSFLRAKMPDLVSALLDELERLRANADDDTAIVSRARDICTRRGYVVEADTEGWTTCALRSLEAEVAAARKVLETAIELPGYYAYAVIDVDAAAWQAWQARRKP